VARTKLVEEHMGLVRSVAFRYRGRGLPVEDLVQEGAIGLLTAIEDYDAGRGASFATYAFWRVRAAVTHALTAEGQLVRVPRPVLERRRQVRRLRESLAATGREPTAYELAAAAELSVEEIADALTPRSATSLDQPTPDGRTLGERVRGDAGSWPEAQALDHEQEHALHGALRDLRGRKRTIISRHFGLTGNAEPLTDIADDLRLSPERTRALKDEALRELATKLAPAVGG
jgi:RNA polymerase primary sigma factor